jgi:high-affinity iron transporter
MFLAALLIKGTYRLDLKRFFGYTSILLVVFAAGLSGYGVHELIEAGEGMGIDFGVLEEKPFDINPLLNSDGSYPLFHEKGVASSILKALIGYDGNPEWLRVVVYLGYWLVVGSYVYRSYKGPKATEEVPELKGVAVEQVAH